MGQQKKEKLLEENFIKRCADTFADERGLVIPLEDSDLIKALEDYPNMGVDAIENILASKYEQIVFEKQSLVVRIYLLLLILLLTGSNNMPNSALVCHNL